MSDVKHVVQFSGGKDSCVILALAKMAGINYEAHYNVTSVDPPELVRFIKREYPDNHGVMRYIFLFHFACVPLNV